VLSGAIRAIPAGASLPEVPTGPVDAASIALWSNHHRGLWRARLRAPGVVWGDGDDAAARRVEIAAVTG